MVRIVDSCADPGWGVGQGVWNPSKNHKAIVFVSNAVPDHMKNDRATKSAFHVGPTSARQRNSVYMAFRWRADDGPF